MRIGSYEFSPALWPTLITLILLPFLTALGLWQLERAEWKQGLVDTHADRISMAPLPVEAVLDGGDLPQYRRMVASGEYDLDHQILLDNRTHRGRAGYHVLTPLKLAERDAAVLVNRGWVPTGSDRAILPALPGPGGVITVLTILKQPPKKVFLLDDVEEVRRGWPVVIQHIDFADLGKQLGYELLPVILLLDAQQQYGFEREWKPVYGTSPDKHRAYAMQWFTLALVLFCIYIGVNTRRIA
jgi:surfeit locus 1 family protein